MNIEKRSTKVRELRSLIFLSFDTETEFANALGWTKQKLNKITNSLTEPNINDLNALATRLKRPVGEIAEIFLRAQSPNGQHVK